MLKTKNCDFGPATNYSVPAHVQTTHFFIQLYLFHVRLIKHQSTYQRKDCHKESRQQDAKIT